MRTRRRKIVVLVAVALLALGLTPLALGMQIVSGTTPARPPTSSEELEARWDAILDGTVRDGVVDYALLSERSTAIAELIGTLEELGPRSAPSAFRDPDARFAYYLNAYNALVIHAVLVHGVRRSVHEVRGIVEPVAGIGFFWAQRFRLDGDLVSLHGLENDVLRAQFQDARLHAAIVCASASCPTLASEAYRGSTLDEQLASSGRAFASDPRHVRVDDEARVIELSSIYAWYEADFVQHARALGAEPSVLGWIAHHARDGAPLERARAGRYAIRHTPYDWSLNGHWVQAR